MRVLLPARGGRRRRRRDPPRQRRHSSPSAPSPSPGSSMCPPVSEKNTSSSDGWRTSMLSTSTPAASSARTTAVASPGDAVHAGTQPPAVVADADPPRHQRRDGADRLGVRLRQRHLQAGAPARLLQLLRRAVRDHPAVVDHDDAVGQRVGLLEVLRRQQHGDALAEQLPDGLPHPLAARRVQAGRRLVEEQDRRPRHQRRRQVEPPAHAARVALHHPVGGVGQLELLEQLGRPGARRRPGPCRRARRPARGSGVRSAAGRAWRPGRRRRCGGAPRPGVGRRRSPPPWPARRRAGPAWSGSAPPSSCPAPFGPSSPRIDPAGTAKSTPASAWVSP